MADMQTRERRWVAGVLAAGGLLAACGNTKVQSKPSRPVDTAAESPAQLAKLPKAFPVAAVPLPVGSPMINIANDSTKRRRQFQLTYAPAPSTQATFMERYVHTLRSLGYALKQHSYADTPNALYSLEDTKWEVLVEGSSSTVGISVVALR
ncbi:hypothetical protein [Ferrimicrobium sp.]|uniref:hypothetical protein n=1 Tax=Ferrimicrobium sp. TaxID=2926050 RepID=UPI0026240667|nr:hypothetical protein [Ferrimicrobium sp.]